MGIHTGPVAAGLRRRFGPGGPKVAGVIGQKLPRRGIETPFRNMKLC